MLMQCTQVNKIFYCATLSKPHWAGGKVNPTTVVEKLNQKLTLWLGVWFTQSSIVISCCLDLIELNIKILQGP